MVKNPPANAGGIRDASSIPGSGRFPGKGHGKPLQYSCLENPMERGGWWATVHRVTKSLTQLKQLSTHTHRHTHTHAQTHTHIYTPHFLYPFLHCFHVLAIINKATISMLLLLLSHFSHVQLCATPCMDYSPPDSSVHGILQARVLEWVALPFSRGSS